MALNAVAAIADVATVGTGGGLAVRGIALGARATKLAKAAKVIDTTHTIYETGKATVAASTAIKKGDFAGAAINTTAAVLGGATLKKYRGRRAIQNLLPRTANGKANAGQYSKLKQLYKSLDTSKLEKPDLTRSQKRAVKGVENAIREHATFDDFRGVANEMTGHLIPKGGGEFFDHINEMSETSTRLSKLIGSLTGSLQNPQMDAKTREYLTESLGKAKYTLEKMSRAMNN